MLSQLNISNCPKLDYIQCERSYYNNTSLRPSFDLGVTACSNLLNIYVRTQTLTNFDISDCVNLDTVDVAFNNLTSITLDSSVKYLDCTGNAISSLDLGYFKRLKELHCASNRISHLSIDGCTNLETLACADIIYLLYQPNFCPS